MLIQAWNHFRLHLSIKNKECVDDSNSDDNDAERQQPFQMHFTVEELISIVNGQFQNSL